MLFRSQSARAVNAALGVADDFSAFGCDVGLPLALRQALATRFEPATCALAVDPAPPVYDSSQAVGVASTIGTVRAFATPALALAELARAARPTLTMRRWADKFLASVSVTAGGGGTDDDYQQASLFLVPSDAAFNGKLYREAPELANIAEHHHLVCLRCGKIEDVEHCGAEAVQYSSEKIQDVLVGWSSIEPWGGDYVGAA